MSEKKNKMLQEWHLLFDSGFELVITSESAEITRNGYGEVTNIHWNGIKDNVPIKANLEECKLIYYKEVKDLNEDK